jgi:hypothetical protein
MVLQGHAAGSGWMMQVRKRRFLRHLYIKVIFLPRQARDNHRENTQKKAVLSKASGIHTTRPQAGARKTAPFFLNFSYVSPEPVLAK